MDNMDENEDKVVGNKCKVAVGVVDVVDETWRHPRNFRRILIHKVD